MIGRLALDAGEPVAHPARRQHEDGQQHQRQQRDPPRDAEHHRQGEDEHHEVPDHSGQGAAERPLGADHVVVEATDQRAGPGPGEERDGHPLDVVEHGRPQVQDQRLADARREPPGDQTRSPRPPRRQRRSPTPATPRPSARTPPTIALTTRPARTGVATASAAPATLRTMKPTSLRRCGRANSRIRRAVAALKTRRSSAALIRRYIWLHAIDSILTAVLRPTASFDAGLCDDHRTSSQREDKFSRAPDREVGGGRRAAVGCCSSCVPRSGSTGAFW